MAQALCSPTSKSNKLKILLLGRSGVGKSRFINSFANYVQFRNISEVRSKSDVSVRIPCIFQICDENRKPRVFKLGEEINQLEQNESLNLLESQTRSCKKYDFHFEDISITLIDTPGIVDTEGVDKDKQNLEKTLEFITRFDTINAICILLKPDEQRLDIILRYCFLEILNQFDRSAARNIIFAFTHSRRTRFGPGGTDIAIQKVIEDIRREHPDQIPDLTFGDENSFYFDSEAFEFIVAKNDIQFDEVETLFYTQSWNKSRAECLRMIKHINSLPQHDVSTTLSIFRARHVIENLIPLILEISRVITENEEIVREKENEIVHFQGTIQQLREVLFITRKSLDFVHFDEPRIVCGTSKCSREIMVNGCKKKHYPQICYQSDKPLRQKLLDYLPGSRNRGDSSDSENGTLSSMFGRLGLAAAYIAALTPLDEMAFGAAAATVGGAALTAVGGVAAIGLGYWYINGQCSTCGCKNSAHILTYHETQEIEERILDATREEEYKEYNSKLDVQSEKERYLALLHEELERLKKEKEVIDRANSVFAIFLKHRSITPFNDAYEEYLDYLIEQEKNQVGGANWNKIERLKGQKRSYQQRKELIDRESEDNGSNIHWSQINLPFIEALVSDMCQLQNYGEVIRSATGAEKKFDTLKRLYLEEKERHTTSFPSNEMKFFECFDVSMCTF